jgi:hypothetical protein
MARAREPEIPYVPYVECWDGATVCDWLSIEYDLPLSAEAERLVLLDAVVLPKKPMVMVASTTSIENVRALAEVIEKVESYIGHEVVAKILSELLGIDVPANSSEYTPKAGDVAVVVRLKKRQQAPQDVKNINIDDLELYIIYYQLDDDDDDDDVVDN